MNRFYRLFRLVADHRTRLLWMVLIAWLYSLFHYSFAFISKYIIRILETGEVPEWMPAETPEKALLLIVLVGIILLFFKCFLYYLRSYLRAWLSMRVVVETQEKIARHMLTLDLGYYQRVRTGDLISRFTNDMRNLARSVSLFCQMLSGPIMLIMGIAAVFYFDWRLAFISLIGAPLGGLAVRSLSRKMRKSAKKALEKQADITSVMVQFLSGIRTVKAFCCEEQEYQRTSQELNDLFQISMKGARARSRVRPVVEVIAATGTMAVLYIGGMAVLGDRLPLSDLVAFLATLGLMYAPAKEVSNANSEAQETLPAAERIFEIFDIEPEIKDSPDAEELPGFHQEIELRNVQFAYRENQPVLKDINLIIPRGKQVALVGPSGAGKSTLVDLVARFHDSQQGQVLIDGRDVRKIRLASLLQHIAIVSQEPFLFHTTIRNNIAYGRPEADQHQIEQAARAANIHEEIIAMPEAYDTIAGERGGRFSGGQRQRICIARAILRDAPILILDEATSSLDAEGELLVQEALERLMKNRTSLVIAHRLSTIMHADEIIVLEDGRMTARGTHQQLSEQGETYARLWRMQTGAIQQEDLT